MKTRRKPEAAERRAISHQLRRAIEDDGRTAYALGQEAEVDPGIVQRFLNGERGLSLTTVDRLSLALGLRLVEGSRGRGRPTKGSRSEPSRPEPAEAPGAPVCQLAEVPEPPPVEVDCVEGFAFYANPIGQSADPPEPVEPPASSLFGDSKLSGLPEPEPATTPPGPTGFLALFAKPRPVEDVEEC